jgi:hypothetical protein
MRALAAILLLASASVAGAQTMTPVAGATGLTGTPNTVSTTPSATTAGCFTIVVYDQNGKGYESTYCPPGQ